MNFDSLIEAQKRKEDHLVWEGVYALSDIISYGILDTFLSKIPDDDKEQLFKSHNTKIKQLEMELWLAQASRKVHDDYSSY